MSVDEMAGVVISFDVPAGIGIENTLLIQDGQLFIASEDAARPVSLREALEWQISMLEDERISSYESRSEHEIELLDMILEVLP